MINIFPKTISRTLIYWKEVVYNQIFTYQDFHIFIYIYEVKYKSWFSNRTKTKYIRKFDYPSSILKSEITIEDKVSNIVFRSFLNRVSNEAFIEYLNKTKN